MNVEEIHINKYPSREIEPLVFNIGNNIFVVIDQKTLLEKSPRLNGLANTCMP